MLAAIIVLANKSHSQEPLVIIPVGVTYKTIKPYYTHKAKAKAVVVKPKKANYCPAENADYQCPMPKGQNGLRERKGDR